MKLAQLIRRLDQLNDQLSIYAAPRWTPSSEAVAAVEPMDGSLPPAAEGKTFLLTVRQARRAVRGRRVWRPDLPLSAEDMCAAVIYYAIYDELEPLPSAHSGEIQLPIAI